MRKVVPFIAVVLLILGYAVFTHFGDALRSIIESAGSDALGTKVSVGRVDVSLQDKKAGISGLAIANPSGFTAKDILDAGTISATLGDIANNTITIKEVNISDLMVNYELGTNGANFDALQKKIKSAALAEKNADSGKSGYKVVIERLKITNAQLKTMIGGAKSSLTLPEITLTNIGSKNAPATPQQVASRVMNSLMSVSSSTLMKSGLPVKIPGSVSTGADKAKTMMKGLFSK